MAPTVAAQFMVSIQAGASQEVVEAQSEVQMVRASLISQVWVGTALVF